MPQARENLRAFIFRKGLIGDQEDIRESHYHSLYEVFLLRRGSLRFQAGGYEHEVAEGSLVIVPKGVSHRIVYGNGKCERDLIQFSLDYISPVIGAKMYRFFSNNLFFSRKETLHGRICDIFSRIEEEYEYSDGYSDEMLRAYINELLTLVLRHPQYQNRAEMSGTRATALGIEDTVRYIAAHFQKPITLEEMARRASVSISHYSRSFREATGYGFKEYLNMVRIAEARRLLLGTDRSICDVAYACGFNDSNYFSTCFKQMHGESPLSFRRSHRMQEKQAEYDHRAYVQDPAGSRHSVLRITSDRGETVAGSRTTSLITVSAKEADRKQVSFRIYIPSRGANRMIGDFFTESGFPVLYQIYVMTGGVERDAQHYLTMLSLRALSGAQCPARPNRFTVVDGFDLCFCSGEGERVDLSQPCVSKLSLDLWHDVKIAYDFSDRENPIASLSVDGEQIERTHLFYQYPDGMHYHPAGSVSLQICTLMRTRGSVYVDNIGYSEEINPTLSEGG